MTLVRGNEERFLFDLLKSYGLQKSNNRVFITPALTGVKSSAPATKGKRKYPEVTLTFGFDPAIFNNTKVALPVIDDDSKIDISVVFAIDQSLLSPHGREIAAEGNQLIQETFDKYPELGELFNDFLPKWREAYARALATQDAEEVDDHRV